ncbi:phosphatidylserine decarboxylase [Campylobacter sp. faydin G-24]|uniref:phosphatidylserine decarboxylase n=1 Tax=Campylobacter anatolicus TaxID=2829105 RepID=A0ABS5HFH5_9BACT|nr:phosphatidylserine decarboxylase [Campylobacter anatolicus]MBR8462574.1 phosphatidylserine decarboxylase [Campylobacter anatolicus]MBR8462993.1 phosphatidylserine decarboxylase [Campylobacter anatolicus]
MSNDKVISRIFGRFSGIKFPKIIQNFINTQYVKCFKIDMSEFQDAKEYVSLNALFTRSLIKPRMFDTAEQIFISPSDGTCLSVGTSEQSRAFSIKGMSYDMAELLGYEAGEDLSNSYDFANIYLSPKDYHRYHAPCDINIKKAIYIPGRLYSVAVKWLKKVDSLYTKNERVALECEISSGKKLWLVFVGALNVGKMKFVFDERIQTNAMSNFTQIYEYDNLKVKKGDELGNFELGSTIVIISEKDAIEYNLFEGKSLKFAESIGMIK